MSCWLRGVETCLGGAPALPPRLPPACPRMFPPHVLRSRALANAQRKFLSLITGDKGLLVTEGKEHKRHRAILNKHFEFDQLKVCACARAFFCACVRACVCPCGTWHC